MNQRVKIAQVGLGPIGVECLKLAAAQPWAQLVGAVDIAPEKVGTRLSRWTGEKRLARFEVVDSIERLEDQPDLVFHTAVSRFKAAFPQLQTLARLGIDVISSCEELVFPRLTEPVLAARLDRLCRGSGARIVGTGVNPGFVMDVLPLCLTGVAREVRQIHVQRVVNASTRREPLQRKIGAGLPPSRFWRLLRAGQAGHAGLKESLALIVHALGWQLHQIRESGKPVIATRQIQTQFVKVQKGQTCGLHQRAVGQVGDGRRLTLDLKMYLDAEDPHDAVQIDGTPPLRLRIEGGVPGDQATVAALVNTARRLMRAQPGLRLLTELPLG